MAIDADVASTLRKLSNTFGGFGDNWKGTSFTSIRGKVESFASDFGDPIDGQIKNFNNAVEELTKLIGLKDDLKKAEAALDTETGNLKAAEQNNNPGDVQRFRNSISTINQNINNINADIEKKRKEINDLLEQVMNGKLDSVEAKSYESSFFGKKVDYMDDDNFNFYSMHDSRWANKTYEFSDGTYGAWTYARSACGPTSLAMIISSLTGDDSITPETIANWCIENGLHPDGGTSETFVKKYVETHSDKFNYQNLTGHGADAVKQSLEDGNLIAVNVRGGTYNDGGHYMVIRGYNPENNTVKIADPNSKNTSTYRYETSYSSEVPINQLMSELQYNDYNLSAVGLK